MPDLAHLPQRRRQRQHDSRGSAQPGRQPERRHRHLHLGRRRRHRDSRGRPELQPARGHHAGRQRALGGHGRFRERIPPPSCAGQRAAAAVLVPGFQRRGTGRDPLLERPGRGHGLCGVGFCGRTEPGRRVPCPPWRSCRRGSPCIRIVPNPFNPSTTLRFDLPQAGKVELTIYDVAGRRVRTLVRETRLPGVRKVIWRGRDESGRQVASGVYLYKLKAGSHVETRRMTLVK